MALAEIAGMLGTFLNSGIGGQIAGQLLGSIGSSIASQIFSGTKFGGQSNYDESSSGGWNMTSQSGETTSESVKQGSISGIANALLGALTTPTGNNAKWAAGFNQESATTANNLQSAQWNIANLLNQSSTAIANLGSMASQTSAMRYNSKEAELARNWQKEMRGTAYQDTMKDLKAAGLNPILAAGNGATSTPTASGTASTQAMKLSAAQAAAVPAAKSATAQAMYDYGNNTSQFVNNMLQTINAAKEYGYDKVATSLETAMEQGAFTSSKSIGTYAEKTDSETKTEQKDKKLSGGISGGIEAHLGKGTQQSGRGRLNF